MSSPWQCLAQPRRHVLAKKDSLGLMENVHFNAQALMTAKRLKEKTNAVVKMELYGTLLTIVARLTVHSMIFQSLRRQPCNANALKRPSGIAIVLVANARKIMGRMVINV